MDSQAQNDLFKQIADEWANLASKDKSTRKGSLTLEDLLADPVASFDEVVSVLRGEPLPKPLNTVKRPANLPQLLAVLQQCYRFAMVHESTTSLEIEFDKDGNWSIRKKPGPHDPLFFSGVSNNRGMRACLLTWLERISGVSFVKGELQKSLKGYCLNCGAPGVQSPRKHCGIYSGCNKAAVHDWIQGRIESFPDVAPEELAADFIKRLNPR